MIGMCAFGIIIGPSVLYLDAIPMLTSALRGYDSACHPLRVSQPPFCTGVPFFHLFADRRFIITFITICVPYPLSLYRDIHNLPITSIFVLCGMLIIAASIMFEGRLVSSLLGGDPSKRFSFVEPGILYWGHQLRFRLPPHFAIDLWEPENADF